MQSGCTCYIANDVDAHHMPRAYTFLWYNADGAKGIVRRAGSDNGPVHAVPMEQLTLDPPRATGAKRRGVVQAEYMDGVEDEF